MHFKVTQRTRALVLDLRRLAAAIDPYVGSASHAAQAEWKATQFSWPSDVELARGFVEICEDDLEVMHSRIRRFGQILGFAETNRRATPRRARIIRNSSHEPRQRATDG